MHDFHISSNIKRPDPKDAKVKDELSDVITANEFRVNMATEEKAKKDKKQCKCMIGKSCPVLPGAHINLTRIEFTLCDMYPLEVTKVLDMLCKSHHCKQCEAKEMAIEKNRKQREEDLADARASIFTSLGQIR
ncbi:hypothetical protein T12_90 [Trichinella patagoniensis]|uniref:Uncharacterized protein n=1 Tax=Trichinella patagoniensis TaxID=990121 RepID=A0A0V0ZVH6_9BILA|nr:hypothetical protein T12_90 [Trichinella patagoniensis]